VDIESGFDVLFRMHAQLMAATSPFCRMLRGARMSADACKANAFNVYARFE
jgi:hypothetical protein